MEFWSQVFEEKDHQNSSSVISNNPFLKNCGVFPEFYTSPQNLRQDIFNLKRAIRKNKFNRINMIIKPFSQKSKSTFSENQIQDQTKCQNQKQFLKSFIRGQKTIFQSKFKVEKKSYMNLFNAPKYSRDLQKQNRIISKLDSSKSQNEQSPTRQSQGTKLIKRNSGNNPQLVIERSLKEKQNQSLDAKLIKKKANKIRQKLPILFLQRQLTIYHKEKEDNKLQTIRKDKPLLTYNINELNQIKADSYLIMQYPTSQLILIHNIKKTLEIASLTKIMTFYVVLKLARQNKINIKQEKIQVKEFVQDISGTSAQIVEGDILTIQQLLYGLMLPSGNDAAMCLADWGGNLITGKQDVNLNVKVFVDQMNKTAKILGLKETRYGNPHGLPNIDSRSTVLDIANLITLCMKNDTFSQIVNTKLYTITFKNNNNKIRQIVWQNTNKLLRREGFIGVKTGITVTAGPCLATCYVFKNRTFIAVLLRTNKVSRRFKETRKILYWALKRLFDDLQDDEKKKLQSLRKNRRDFDSDNSEQQQQFIYSKGDNYEYAKRNKILNYEL